MILVSHAAVADSSSAEIICRQVVIMHRAKNAADSARPRGVVVVRRLAKRNDHHTALFTMPITGLNGHEQPSMPAKAQRPRRGQGEIVKADACNFS